MPETASEFAEAFVRDGVFPFMKLPLELREQVSTSESVVRADTKCVENRRYIARSIQA